MERPEYDCWGDFLDFAQHEEIIFMKFSVVSISASKSALLWIFSSELLVHIN